MQSSLCTPAPVCTACVCMCVLDLSTFFCACFRLPSLCIWYLSALFWAFTQRSLVVCYRPFGTAYRFRLQESREWLTLAWPLKMEPISCPETSEQTTDIQRKIPGEERRSRVLLLLWIFNFACFFFLFHLYLISFLLLVFLLNYHVNLPVLSSGDISSDTYYFYMIRPIKWLLCLILVLRITALGCIG